MTTYRVEVTYAPGNTDVHKGLSAEQVQQASYSFVSDLAHLAGRGVKRVSFEVETDAGPLG